MTPMQRYSGQSQFPMTHLKAPSKTNQLRTAASRRLLQHRSMFVGFVCLALAGALTISSPSSSHGAEPDPSVTQRADGKGNQSAAAAKDPTTTEVKEPVSLPKNVAEMRDALLSAARSADIENLRVPFEWNELPPAISDERVDDPIAHWKNISRDGSGLEILSIIDKLLSLPPAKLHIGPDHENSVLYVWPYLSELDLNALTPRQQFELRTLVPPHAARTIMTTKKWSWWRLAIGADGTWHSFMQHEK